MIDIIDAQQRRCPNMKQSACKQYLKEVKSIFPLWSKEERNFFLHFSSQVKDFEEHTDAKEITTALLYEEIGRPDEVLASYLSQADISYLSRKIRSTRFLKATACVIALCIVVTCVIWSYIIIQEYRNFDEHTIYYEETIIE